MPNFGFSKIFWKIFLTFWLVNLAVIFAASFTIVSNMEATRITNLHEQMARRFAEQIIDRVESGEPMPRFRRFGGPGPKRGEEPSPRLNITRADTNTPVFQHRFRFQAEERTLQFQVTSASGTLYNVETQLPRKPLFMKDMLKRLQSTQFVLILIASTLASALLSWSIARPLKNLGARSREVAGGNLDARPDKKLLQRGDEIGELARDLDHMIHQVAASINGQRQLLHDVSHELRAPLARLQAAAALVEKKPESPQYIAKIHHECDRMNALIQQILDYARFHELPEDRETALLDGLVDDVCSDIRFRYPEHQIEIRSATTRPIHYTGFLNSLQKALTNFLDNACKYSPPNSLVQIQLSELEHTTTIEICDSGCGIAPEHLARVTEPFFQTAAENSQKGFGLGLSIARRAIEKNGGKLDFSNRAEGGLCVTVTLPR
ncbi:sensor histidine kinase [Teredinibacter turnerae]|uniref:sensor histidine kinase n=1 Tax=Teredinibacter turnerae TaxID=2426 RepID=UPI0004216F45|nr:HAMP domain-containing sensor histidine kinase [Teredinibacter turnerae]